MSGITISNIEASFLRDQDWIGDMSPYLEFETSDGESAKTDAAEDAGESASWSLPIQLNGSSSPIKVTAKASKLGFDKTIGTGSVSTEYAGSGPQTVELMSEDGNNVGQVTLQIEGGSSGGGGGYGGGGNNEGRREMEGGRQEGYGDGGGQQGEYGSGGQKGEYGSGGGDQGYGGGGGDTAEYGSGGGQDQQYGSGGGGYGEGEQRTSDY